MPKQLIIKRIILTLLYAVFFIVLPTVIIEQHYHVFYVPATEPSDPVVRVTAGLVILMLLIYFFLRNIIKRAFNSLEPGNVKKIIKTIWASIPLIAVNIVIAITKDAIINLQSCLVYLSVSFVVANYVNAYLDDIEQICNEIKLLKRQDKYRKDYNL